MPQSAARHKNAASAITGQAKKILWVLEKGGSVNIFQESTERIRLAGALGNINQALIDELCKGGEVIELKFKAFTRKGKETFDGARVHQINSYQEGTPHPFKGGIRYTKYKTWQEMIDTTRTLATDMCLKIALTGLPFGPAKGTLNIDP